MQDTFEGITFTRDQAIAHIVGAVTRDTVSAGSQLVDLIGPHEAARLTRAAIDIDTLAFEALGVTQADVKRVAETLRAQEAQG